MNLNYLDLSPRKTLCNTCREKSRVYLLLWLRRKRGDFSLKHNVSAGCITQNDNCVTSANGIRRMTGIRSIDDRRIINIKRMREEILFVIKILFIVDRSKIT